MGISDVLMECIGKLESGRFDEALKTARHAVEKWPQQALAQQIFGRCLLAVNRADEAVDALREAVRLDEASGEGRASLGAALEATGALKEAYESYIAALELDPANGSIIVRVAGFLLNQGQLDEAERLYTCALPTGSSQVIAGLAEICERRGDYDGALQLLQDNADAVAGSNRLVQVEARARRRLDRPDESLALLNGIDVQKLSPAAAVDYFHELGDTWHALRRPDEAFGAWEQANGLREARYDAARTEARIDDIIDLWSVKGFDALPRSRQRGERPVLIVGMPRSGSSLLEQMLSCHPSIFAAGELDDLGQLAGQFDPRSTASVEESAQRYRARLHKLSPDAERVVDKMPHNFLHLGALAQLSPGARVIHCERNPLDVGLSCYRRNFHATHDYATDLGSIGHFIGQQRRLMAHWKEVLPLSILTVKYEDLVADFEGQARRVLDFCGLDWNPAVLEFHRSRRYTATASYDQVRRRVYKDAVGSAEAYGAFLAPLQSALKTATVESLSP